MNWVGSLDFERPQIAGQGHQELEGTSQSLQHTGHVQTYVDKPNYLVSEGRPEALQSSLSGMFFSLLPKQNSTSPLFVSQAYHPKAVL